MRQQLRHRVQICTPEHSDILEGGKQVFQERARRLRVRRIDIRPPILVLR